MLYCMNFCKRLCNFQLAMRFLFIICVIISLRAEAQPLRDINFKYLYSPDEVFTFNMEPVKQPAGWMVLYNLSLRDGGTDPSGFLIQWEIRQSLSDKEGTPISADSLAKGIITPAGISGKFKLESSSQVQLLVAKVLNNQLKRAWFFYKILEPNFPVNGYVEANGTPVLNHFIPVGTAANVFDTNQRHIVSLYKSSFPAGTPAFAEGTAKVSSLLRVDSSFIIQPSDTLRFTEKGLYLIQRDTLVAEGFTIRAELDYPKLARVESLADPMIYVCTRQESERIRQAKGDKRAFDKVILGITGDAGRARIFMRNYFKRVELANQLFSSYKEGWKTDRGMIYIIFGTPDEVYKTNEREVWNYKSPDRVSFDFTRSPTLFDPENYVLIRSKKYQQTWYEIIDLWRNARF